MTLKGLVVYSSLGLNIKVIGIDLPIKNPSIEAMKPKFRVFDFPKWKKLGLSILTLTTAALATGCGTSDKTGLKIGTLLPLTGDLALIGPNLNKAAEMAVEKINSCGGVNGQDVILITEDSKTDPVSSAGAASKLAEVDRVAGIIGGFASSVSSAAADVAVRNKVMLLSPGSTSPVFTERAKKGDFQGYWARTATPDTYQARALAALAKKRGWNKVATVAINNDYGIGFEQEFIEAFQKLGGIVINASNPVRYDPKTSILDGEARAAFAGKPDAVAAILYMETGTLLLQSAFKQGLTKDVQILLSDGVYSEDFSKLVGKDPQNKSIISGALGTAAGAEGAALADFTSLWQEKTGQDWTVYVPNTWDATVLIMLAAEAAGENSGDGIKSQIRLVANAPGQEVSVPCQAMELIRQGKDINYQGASSNVDIDEYGDVVGVFDVWKVNDDTSLEVIDRVTPAQ